jgi:hypothetical protein
VGRSPPFAFFWPGLSAARGNVCRPRSISTRLIFFRSSSDSPHRWPTIARCSLRNSIDQPKSFDTIPSFLSRAGGSLRPRSALSASLAENFDCHLWPVRTVADSFESKWIDLTEVSSHLWILSNPPEFIRPRSTFLLELEFFRSPSEGPSFGAGFLSGCSLLGT